MKTLLPPMIRFHQGYEDGQKAARAGRDVIVTSYTDAFFGEGSAKGHADAIRGVSNPSAAWKTSTSKSDADRMEREESHLYPMREKRL